MQKRALKKSRDHWEENCRISEKGATLNSKYDKDGCACDLCLQHGLGFGNRAECYKCIIANSTADNNHDLHLSSGCRKTDWYTLHVGDYEDNVNMWWFLDMLYEGVYGKGKEMFGFLDKATLKR